MRCTFLEASRFQNLSIYWNTDDLESLKMTIRSILEKLQSVASENKKWTFQDIFKRLKATCFSPSRKSCLNFDQGAEEIASHFQVRKLVFKMLERQFQTRRGGLKVVYPECQVLQYLVPCFVASALDLYKDSSVPHDKKKEYLQFVHELIESYETCVLKMIIAGKFNFHLEILLHFH